MTIEQTVTIPADYRISLELPRTFPSGVTARIEVSVPAISAKGQDDSMLPSAGIDEVRQLLQKEMTEQGTLEVTAASGDGWEAQVREHHAES